MIELTHIIYKLQIQIMESLVGDKLKKAVSSKDAEHHLYSHLCELMDQASQHDCSIDQFQHF